MKLNQIISIFTALLLVAGAQAQYAPQVVDQGAPGSSMWIVDGSGVTQPVSGTVSLSGIGAVATEATLSALSAKFTSLGQKNMAGSVPVVLSSDQSAIPVTGSFYQATQPVSAASLPLPSGASTSANQTTIIASLGVITANQTNGTQKVDGSGVTQPISATALPLPSGASTSANQTTMISSLGTINTTLGSPFQAGGSIGNSSFGISGTLPAFAATPTVNLGTIGTAATAANQTTANSSLSSIDGKLHALGQNAMSSSMPVTFASNQTPATDKTTSATLTGTQTSTFVVEGYNELSLQIEAASTLSSGWVTISKTLMASPGAQDWITFTMVQDIGFDTYEDDTMFPGPGVWRANVAGLYQVRIECNTCVGNAIVDLRASITRDGYALIPDQVSVIGGSNANDVTQGSTTSGQKGPLAQMATTTSQPVYTTAKTNPLSGDTSGRLRVTANIASFGDTAISTGTGAGGAGIPRVTVSNDSTVGLVAGSAVIGHVINDASSAVIGHVIVDTAPSTTVTGTVTVNQGTSAATTSAWPANIASFGSTAISTGTGTGGAGIPRVTVSNDSVVGIAAGSALIGKVGIDQTTPGTTNLVQDFTDTTNGSGAPTKSHVVGGVYNSSPATLTTGQVGSLQLDATQNLLTRINFALPTGTNSIGAVTIASGASSFVKAEDTASADLDAGVPAMAIRKATPANTSGTDGDYEMLQMSSGRLWTSTAIDTALPAGSAVIGHVINDASSAVIGHVIADTGSTTAVTGNVAVNQTQMNGTSITANRGASDSGTQRVAVASDSQISLGTDTGKTNKFNTGSIITAATTARQVMFTYTVTSGKTLYVQNCTLEGRLTTPSATATILGIASLESPASTTIASNMFMNPTTSTVDRVNYFFAEPVPIASGTVFRAVTSPNASTSMTWLANCVGYER